MKFSENTNKIIKCLMGDNIKYNVKTANKNMNKHNKHFFNLINGAFEEVDGLKHRIQKSIIDIKSVDDIPNTSLFNSHFVPNPIKEYIKTQFKGYIKLSLFYNKTNISVVIPLKNEDYNRLNDYDEYTRIIFAWFILALKHSTLSVRSLNLYLFMSEIDKKLPESSLEILEPLNCNSAVTTACNANGEILVYRKEEWLKVLMHETMHILCLDFSGMEYEGLKKNVAELFPIESDFLISETYSEFWGNTMNNYMLSYILMDDVPSLDMFIKFNDLFTYYEKMFSLLQLTKILNHMGLVYEDLYSKKQLSVEKRKLYKEKTNVFVYYILKAVLLYHKEEFIIWCDNANDNIINFAKTPETFASFFEFIRKHSNKSNMLCDLNNIRLFHKRIKNKTICDVTRDTMRMSLFGLA
tara:strand:+ start:873 stop:2102 length:1230 start_codon:yes stop_codon:yes gene_type:complete